MGGLLSFPILQVHLPEEGGIDDRLEVGGAPSKTTRTCPTGWSSKPGGNCEFAIKGLCVTMEATSYKIPKLEKVTGTSMSERWGDSSIIWTSFLAHFNAPSSLLTRKGSLPSREGSVEKYYEQTPSHIGKQNSQKSLEIPRFPDF